MENSLTINKIVCESISLALVQLMNKKPFNQITISEITKTAGVGRSSFYRNFDSKEQILLSYIHNLYGDFFSAKDILSVYPKQTDLEHFLIPRFRFIKKHKDFFIALRKNNLLYYIFEQMEPELILLLCGQDNSLSKYYCSMFSGSCASIVRLWIDTDFKETEEEMAAIFANHPLSTLYSN
ncbi:MAG: TetR/AcrR family transcriptional regulator [Lachnospiraceae bacterium]|nr:TetR/AcrR family transcriptional regulator [Lachnospiraceae bacterium]